MPKRKIRKGKHRAIRSQVAAWELVWKNRGLMYTMGRYFVLPPDIQDEMIEDVGLLAMFNAARLWTATRGVKFSTYVCKTLWRRYAQWIFKYKRQCAKQIPEFDENTTWWHPTAQSSEYEPAALFKSKAFRALSVKGQDLLIQRYVSRKTLTVIGRCVHATPECVRQRIKRQLERLRKELECE